MDFGLKALFGFSNRASLKEADLIIPLTVKKGSEELFYVVEPRENEGSIVSAPAKDLDVAKKQKDKPEIIDLTKMTEKGVGDFQTAVKNEALGNYEIFLKQTNDVRAKMWGITEPIKNDFARISGDDIALSDIQSAYTGLSTILGRAAYEEANKRSAGSEEYKALQGYGNEVKAIQRKLEIAEKLPQLRQNLIEKIEESADITPKDKHHLGNITEAHPFVLPPQEPIPKNEPGIIDNLPNKPGDLVM